MVIETWKCFVLVYGNDYSLEAAFDDLSDIDKIGIVVLGKNIY
jgi:hypothetical protein